MTLFTSSSCGKCKTIKPSLKEIIASYDVEYAEINVDNSYGMRQALDQSVISLPTLIIQISEKETKRFVSEIKIEEVIKILEE